MMYFIKNNCLRILFVIILCSLQSIVGQDLQYECISCADVFDKCELDCSWSLPYTNLTTISDCQNDCLMTKHRCVDTPQAQACASCSLECAEPYDTAMRRCLSMVSRVTTATYGNQQLAECEEQAALTMDDCMKTCGTT